jgi:2-hydroxy-3-oxopropionate reductase
MSKKIGFIGLGAMGLPIARNLLMAGHTLFLGCHINRKPAIELEKKGAVICHSYAEVATQAEVIFLILPDAKEIDEVLFAVHGVVSGMTPGKIVVDMSTIDLFKSKTFAEKLAEVDCEYIDAPVSGGPLGAEKGTLAIMIGAKEQTFEQIRGLLSAIAKTIVYCGENGLGLAAKMANNLIASSTIIAISEALTLAIKAGIDPDSLYQVLKGGTANSALLNIKFPAYLEDNYEPGFKLSLMCKDLGIITNVAKQLGVPTLLGSVVEQIYNLCKPEHGQKDSGAVSLFYQEHTGVSFKSRS